MTRMTPKGLTVLGGHSIYHNNNFYIGFLFEITKINRSHGLILGTYINIFFYIFPYLQSAYNSQNQMLQ